MQRELGRDARRTASRRVRTATGNRRKRRANAPRYRGPDRGVGRTQSYRCPARAKSRCDRADPSHTRGADARCCRRAHRAQRRATRRRHRAMKSSSVPRSGPRPVAYAPRRAASRRRSPPATPISTRSWLADRPSQSRLARGERAAARITARANTREPATTRGSDDRSPRHTIESLDSLSVDIARMIDHDAAADLWDRYKRGERNVFTRRLYTLQGQQAFDDIRKKYRADREFKQTVDRYISEFERLARRGFPRRSRTGGGANLSHVGNGQGLHHAGACGGPLRLIRTNSPP